MQYLTDRFNNTIKFLTSNRCLDSGRALLLCTKRISLVAAIGITALATIGMTWQAVSEWRDGRNFPAPGERVDIGGYRLHMLKQGQQGPVVVLEAGLGCNHMDWTHVQKELAKQAVVISYDRAGYGWSDQSPLIRTSGNEVEELNLLLKKSGTKGPYILVGHSFGGLNARLFAARYPELVAGIVLVDSCHEEQSQRMVEEDVSAGLEKWTAWGNPEWGPLLTRIGLTRFFLPHLNETESLKTAFPANLYKAYLAKSATQGYANAAYQENLYFDRSGAELKKEERPLKRMPLVVMTAGEPLTADAKPEDRAWIDMHKEILAKSEHGIHMYAEESDHYIPWNQPAKVVEAVEKIIRIAQPTLGCSSSLR